MKSTKTPFTLIVADIHLYPDSENPINLNFMRFLDTQANQAEALYIIGDLFEMWVGDDIGVAEYSDVIKQLKKLSDNGVNIYLQYGNRDFLMLDEFFQATGIQRMQDVEVVTLYNTPYLLLHGDTLCTDDKGYQRLRRVFRSWLFRFFFLKKSKEWRIGFGNKMRAKSQHKAEKVRQKSKLGDKPKRDYVDVNQLAVEKLFSKHPNIQHMIHGHTHKPDHHVLYVDNRKLHRWVLGDWCPQAKIIKVSESGPELLDYPA